MGDVMLNAALRDATSGGADTVSAEAKGTSVNTEVQENSGDTETRGTSAGHADISGITVNSCGLGGWHIGDSADPRTIAALERHGYDGTAHVAAQFNEDHADADVFLAMDRGHVRGLKSLGVDPERIYLVRAFDPDAFDAEADLDGFRSLHAPEVADPYYENDAAFETVFRQLESALPGVVRWLQS